MPNMIPDFYFGGQNALLGHGCPCEGCHQKQRSDFFEYVRAVGLDAVVRRMIRAVMDNEITWERLAGLSIISRWLRGLDVGGRYEFPPLWNKPSEKMLEAYRPRLRSLIVEVLIANHKVVSKSSDREQWDDLISMLEPVSNEGVEKIRLWCDADAINRPVEPEVIRWVYMHHLPGRLVVDIKNDTFEARWDAFLHDGLQHLAGHYFDPQKDHELLENHLRDQPGEVVRAFFDAIPKRSLKWRRFITMNRDQYQAKREQ